MAQDVSDTDRAIIRLLQQNARGSFAEVSRATGIPESTVRRRMDRLQERGVITFAVVADPARLGYEVRAMVGLKVDLVRLDEIADQLRAMNEVTFAAVLTGSFDLVIHVVVESPEALMRFLSRRIAPIAGIRSAESFMMPAVIKPTTAWLLPEAATAGPTKLDATDGKTGEVTPARAASRQRGRPRRVAS